MTTEARPDDIENQLDAVLEASRVLVGIVARSLAEVDGVVSLLQLRTLVILSGSPSLSLRDVADQLDVHASNATRVVDRLVSLKLVSRREATHDRRYVTLRLTAKGERLVDRVMNRRRDAIRTVIGTMESPERRDLALALRAFTQAAGGSDGPADELVLQLPT